MEHNFHSIVWVFNEGMKQKSKVPLHHLESERNRIDYNNFIPILPLYIKHNYKKNNTNKILLKRIYHLQLSFKILIKISTHRFTSFVLNKYILTFAPYL
jgi:hypothetical protein